GLTSTSATTARNILYDLAGSIGQVQQGFDLTSSKPPLRFQGIQEGVTRKVRDWRASELSVFFKDEWKVTPNLTLNLGARWEYYGVPYEANGIAGRAVGDERRKGLCGYACGGPVTVELVGKNSPNPNLQLYHDDWNNFAPAVGFSWSVPGFGRSTILRGGYAISYAGRAIAGAMGADGLDLGAGQLPGLSAVTAFTGLTYTKTGYWSLANLSEVPFAPQFEPLRPVPLTDPRTLTMNVYDPERRTPYVQNFNLSIQRELASNLILDVSYIGNQSTALFSRLPLNAVKIGQNQFLEAFNVTRTGGDHPLFDRMLMGLTIPGSGRVDGRTLTGSSALRRYTNTLTLLANGSVGGLADFLNRTTNVTGAGGGFLRNGSFAEDFLVDYPQFTEMGLNGNAESSTYHSLQAQLTKRLSHGFTNQTSYTWSKTMGISSGGTTRDPGNRNLDRAVLSFHRTHIVTSNGTYALPFGENRAFLGGSPAWVKQLAGQWQVGALFRWSTGAPLTLTAGGLSNLWQTANNTPHLLGELPGGRVIRHTDGRRPTFWEGLAQVNADPGRVAAVTTRDSLNAAGSTRAIRDAQGNLLLVNPAPGQVGSLGRGTVEGPSRFQLDMNLQKRVRIDEKRDLEFRADVVNVLNHPIFGSPVTDINSANFGQIQSAENGRRFTLSARINF
ncbi:MAG: TonB-dependent receptor, partial [Acidobacteria bacterium]|nr:TonB-dependent receptor [Acidobacteriota bacterium]